MSSTYTSGSNIVRMYSWRLLWVFFFFSFFSFLFSMFIAKEALEVECPTSLTVRRKLSCWLCVSVLPPVLVPRYSEFPSGSTMPSFQSVPEPNMPHNVTYPFQQQHSPNPPSSGPGSPFGLPGKHRTPILIYNTSIWWMLVRPWGHPFLKCDVGFFFATFSPCKQDTLHTHSHSQHLHMMNA